MKYYFNKLIYIMSAYYDIEIITQVYVSNQVIKMISKDRSHEELILELQFMKISLIKST